MIECKCAIYQKSRFYLRPLVVQGVKKAKTISTNHQPSKININQILTSQERLVYNRLRATHPKAVRLC